MITVKEIQENDVRALTWKQPFASLMLHGKQETRVSPTHVRGLVLICAGLVPYTLAKLTDLSGEAQIKRMAEVINPNEPYILGQAIAIGRLVDSKPMPILQEEGEEYPGQRIEDKTFVKLSTDLHVHFYEDVTPIVPFPWKGCQGWTKLTQEQKQLIKFL